MEFLLNPMLWVVAMIMATLMLFGKRDLKSTAIKCVLDVIIAVLLLHDYPMFALVFAFLAGNWLNIIISELATQRSKK